ncbi:MAG: DnaJ domain-containing protein [Fimbriimonadales bacterium]
MSERTHYVELGVSETATAGEIRTAYRRLVLLYHPDRSGDKATTERFVRISEAYRALADDKARGEYDAGLKYRRDREKERTAPPKPQPTRAEPTTPKSGPRTVGDEIARVQQAAAMFSAGKYDHAESILNMVLKTTPGNALAHAMLGDIAAQRGDLRQAITRYSYAVQFAPNNAAYQRRYEELFAQSTKVTRNAYVEAKDAKAGPIIVATLLVSLMAVVISVSRDKPIFPGWEIVDTLSFTFVLLAFLAGITVGVAVSIGKYVDSLRGVSMSASGRASPLAVVFVVGAINFWVAALSYFATGLARDAFTYSASRVIAIVAAITILFALCASMSSLSPLQAVLWGGNIVWAGALAGWAIADGFR